MSEPYIVPEFQNSAFHCPHCGVYAHQKWHNLEFTGKSPRYFLSKCEHCQKSGLWIAAENEIGQLVYPQNSASVPPPLEDIPSDVKDDYEEARKIVDLSPRGSTALLRLALAKLMIHLGEDGKNLNDNIRNLVRKGLPERVQKSLDTVRVIGNDAVHPGTLDLRDNVEIATALFRLINVIVDTMLIQPREIDEIYKRLPPTTHDAINKRDGKV